MTIVLNEHEWAKQMISSRSLGKKPFETLSRVARYYKDSGYNKSKTREKLDRFLIQCDPTASLPKWSDLLDHATERAMKTKAIQIEYIEITTDELDIIDKLDGKQIKRLAFTLLCLSKYWDYVNPNSEHWVNNKDSEIMRMANINTSIKRQSMMYHQLNDAGLIQFSKKVDNTNVRVCFGGGTSVAMRVSDFRNLGYQYLMFTGSKDYICCENCGMIVRKNTVNQNGLPQRGRPQKYCRACATEIRNRNAIKAATKMRDAKRQQS